MPPAAASCLYFDEIYRTYGNDAAVVAIHSDLVTDDVEAYLANYDYQLPFALDETGSVIQSFGGSTMLPPNHRHRRKRHHRLQRRWLWTYEVLENLLSQAEESANPNQDHKTGRRIGKKASNSPACFHAAVISFC